MDQLKLVVALLFPFQELLPQKVRQPSNKTLAVDSDLSLSVSGEGGGSTIVSEAFERQTIDVTNEFSNRIWKSKVIPDYLNIYSTEIPGGSLFSENTPPWLVMAYAIQAHNLTDSIYLTFDFSPQQPTVQQTYFVLYFMDPLYRSPRNQTSRVKIYINNNKLAVMGVPFDRDDDRCRVMTLCPVPIVAGFYYGNYDGLSKPPSFRLEIDGKFWANVTALLSKESVYHELLYNIKGEKVTVCLVRMTDDEVPFISSLEATELLSDSYKFLDNNTALYLHSRINYGANERVE
ncbi:putative LRR receptor-like serine/threonine-protein kinase [Camellia lanceoleosa]|uniref:LRR receptor-like serine/threonine-protein kinase n=1 Tax=Camellia lanceoleosa TaxID=1840588 RepID=A0ACC0F4A3_9ERIC|nr:putative LRR receptor-like serine/threonine-protein kinase [Camellia lanceoleosa]